MVTQSSRIITRSRAKQNPTQYTLIPADQKILKILVEELLPASGPEPKSAISAAAGGSPEDDDEDDEEWEDDPHDFLDLGSGMTKEQLMAFGEGRGTEARGRGDDETQRYLVEWFRGLAQRPGADQVWSRLSDGEKERISGWLG